MRSPPPRPPRLAPPRSEDDDDFSATLARLGTPLPAPGADTTPFDSDWLERALESEGGLAELKKRIEFEAIGRALRASNGNITRAAERLGMKRP